MEQDRYSFAVCAPRAGLVPSTTGFSIHVPLGLAALKSADTVIVPGYGPSDEPPPAVLHALQAAATRGARVVSVCTGAFALAAAGLLDGRRATTHWRAAAELAARYPGVEVDADVLYLDDGQVATSAGIAAGIDLCLHPVRNDHGADAAARVARRLLEVSDLSVEQIAARCGLGTAANLRLHLARDTSTTPTAYRRTYQGSSPRHT